MSMELKIKRVLFPMYHMYVVDRLAELFPELDFYVIGKGRFGDFGFPKSRNVYVIYKDFKTVSSEKFDLFIDPVEAINWNGEEYYQIATKITIPRILKNAFSPKPRMLEYYERYKECPFVFESETYSREWRRVGFNNIHIIYNPAISYYNAKWKGNIPKALGVFNYYKKNRDFKEDSKLLLEIENIIGKTIYIHDGSEYFLSEEGMVKLFSSMRCYVEGSFLRGITNAFLQAVSIGMPTIVLDKDTDYAKFIKNDYNGFKVKNGEEACEKIKELIDDFQLAKRMHLNMKKVARERLEPSKIREKWINLINEVTCRR